MLVYDMHDDECIHSPTSIAAQQSRTSIVLLQVLAVAVQLSRSDATLGFSCCTKNRAKRDGGGAIK